MADTSFDINNGVNQIAPNAMTQQQIFYGDQFARKILGSKEEPLTLVVLGAGVDATMGLPTSADLIPRIVDFLETDEDGNVTVVHATYDPETKSGSGFTGRKVKGTIHWVAADTAAKAEVRLYENIVDEEKGVYNEDGSINVNPNSLTILKECYMEPALKEAKPGDKFQFMRTGFFCVDTKDTTAEHMVFNRIVSLKSSYRPNK